jgi:hypothetical protein
VGRQGERFIDDKVIGNKNSHSFVETIPSVIKTRIYKVVSSPFMKDNKMVKLTVATVL